MINELPLYFHPTRIMLVDDDINYSKNVEIIMWNKEVPIRVFNDPRKALEFIKHKQVFECLDKLVQIEEEYLERTTFNIDLNLLHQKIYDKDRFEEISVIIVDYAMPGLSGKEFFEKINHSPVKKILLTGEEGYETAVKMFNTGLIDRFYRKNDENLFDKLLKGIAELKIQFFQDRCHAALSALKKKSSALAFTDPDFIQLFTGMLADNQIIEYYALDQGGSYLLIDKTGSPSLFIVESAEDMQILYEIAEGERGVPENILTDLKNRRKLAYFPSKKDHIAPAHSWSFYDAYCLQGNKQPFYYTLIKNATIFKFRSEVRSYQQLLECDS